MKLKGKVARPAVAENCQQAPYEAALAFAFVGDLARTEPTLSLPSKNPEFFPLGESAYRQESDINHFYLEKNYISMC